MHAASPLGDQHATGGAKQEEHGPVLVDARQPSERCRLDCALVGTLRRRAATLAQIIPGMSLPALLARFPLRADATSAADASRSLNAAGN